MTQEDLNKEVQKELEAIKVREAEYSKTYDVKIIEEIARQEELTQTEEKKQLEIFLKQEKEILELQESINAFSDAEFQKALQELKEQELKDAEDSKEETEEGESTDDNYDRYRLKFPNKTSINKLKEKEVVSLGEELGLSVDLSLTVSENKKIVIDFFNKHVW